MPSTIVAGASRQARLAGDEKASGAVAPAAFSAPPLVDPPGAPQMAPRKRAPARVSAGPAVLAQRAPTPAPEPAARRRYPGAPAELPQEPVAPEPIAQAIPEPLPAQAAVAADPMEAPAPVETTSAIPAPELAGSAPTVSLAKAARPPGPPRAKGAAKAPVKAASQTPVAGQARAARNALVGICLAYMDRLSVQVGSPIGFVMRHWALLLIAAAHLAAPVGLSWLAAHSSPGAMETFLQGGLLPNLGKLFLLYLGCAFAWSLAYIAVARLASAARGDLTRFERLGRSLFGPAPKK